MSTRIVNFHHISSLWVVNTTIALIMIVFFGIFVLVSVYFLRDIGQGRHLYLANVAPSFTQLSTTLITLIYTYAFYVTKCHASRKEEEQEDHNVGNPLPRINQIASFFSFNDADADGNFGIIDFLCCSVGVINSVCLLNNMVLWTKGYLSMGTIIGTLGPMNRVVNLFIAKSYMVCSMHD